MRVRVFQLTGYVLGKAQGGGVVGISDDSRVQGRKETLQSRASVAETRCGGRRVRCDAGRVPEKGGHYRAVVGRGRPTGVGQPIPLVRVKQAGGLGALGEHLKVLIGVGADDGYRNVGVGVLLLGKGRPAS